MFSGDKDTLGKDSEWLKVCKNYFVFNHHFSAHAYFSTQSLSPQKFERLDFNGSHLFFFDRRNHAAMCAIMADMLENKASKSNTALKITSCCQPIMSTIRIFAQVFGCVRQVADRSSGH